MNKVKLCYFVGNANGRGMVRIEIDGQSENAGFHVASATRGREAWIAALVDRWNMHEEMVKALRVAYHIAPQDMRQTMWGRDVLAILAKLDGRAS